MKKTAFYLYSLNCKLYLDIHRSWHKSCINLVACKSQEGNNTNVRIPKLDVVEHSLTSDCSSAHLLTIGSIAPSRNTRSYTLRGVPLSTGRSFFHLKPPQHRICHLCIWRQLRHFLEMLALLNSKDLMLESIFKEEEVRGVCWRKCKIGDFCCEREKIC